jgi:uncharacterized protein (TIGR03437 family)
MIRKAETLAMAVLLVAVFCNLTLGQATPPAILEVDVENVVEYQDDISDPSKFASNPNVTRSVPPRNFVPAVVLGDIVAVNGQPAKGTFAGYPMGVALTPTPKPGQAIADTTRVSMGIRTFEILKSDGTPVGTIMCLGLNAGPPPPGSPLSQTGQNFAIVGGTGAFLGARGEQGGKQTPRTIPIRAASMAEDPANRRRNGGGRVRWLLTVIPMSFPQIVDTAAGPAVSHASNLTLVTASDPAAAGEVLSLHATGLGPTRPGVDPGKPVPASPQQVVNAPVEVMVNGKRAEVLAAVGLPGMADGYEVKFRVPPDAVKGTATIQLSGGWIPGPGRKIAIQ